MDISYFSGIVWMLINGRILNLLSFHVSFNQAAISGNPAGRDQEWSFLPSGRIISILRVVIFRDCLGIIDILHVYNLGVVSEV